MGANRAGEVAALVDLARPSVGMITNAGAEHLEGFGSLEGVARAEGEMVAGLAAEATAVINADDEFAPLWRGLTTARVVTFGVQRHADFSASEVRTAVGSGRFPHALPPRARRRAARRSSCTSAARTTSPTRSPRRPRPPAPAPPSSTSPRASPTCARWPGGCSSSRPRAAPGSSTIPTTPTRARCAPAIEVLAHTRRTPLAGARRHGRARRVRRASACRDR